MVSRPALRPLRRTLRVVSVLTLTAGCLVNQELYDERSAALADADRDGFAAEVDCDDHDPAVHPGLPELCDAVDQDCDGLTDEEPTDPTPWYQDADGDGFGDEAHLLAACEAPTGYVDAVGDCDDGDADTHPDAVDTPYDGLDQDCVGGDEEDLDGDGDPAEAVGGGDCDDQDPSRSSTTEEGWLDDGIDNDCDGSTGDPVTWDPASALTRFDGEVTGGQLGRRVGHWPEGDCLLMSAPYTDDTAGRLYAEAGFGTGVHTVGSGGMVHGDGAGAFLSYVIETNPSGRLLLTETITDAGRGAAFLLDAEALCGGAELYVSEDSTLTIQGPAPDTYFGTSGRWIPDLSGTGEDALIIGASNDSTTGPSRGAAYIFLDPPADGAVLSAADADYALYGDVDHAILDAIEVNVDEAGGGLPELLIGEATVTEGGPIVARITAEDLRSGTLSEQSTGTIFSYIANVTPRLSIIEDLSRDGSNELVVGLYDFGMVSIRDIDGAVDVATAFATIGTSAPEIEVHGVASAGDLDGDDRGDLLILEVGWPAGGLQGRVGVLSADESHDGGYSDAEDGRLTATGSSLGDSFGYAAIAVNDLDRDGRNDIAVAAFGTDLSSTGAGSVYLIPSPL